MEAALRNQLIDRMTNAFLARRHGADQIAQAQKHDPDHAAILRDDARRDMEFLVVEIEKRVVMLPKTYPTE